tara:strand:- start:63258 stop:63665 length:408 start_codon:yes stop_codon:yes gene_type:complete
MQECSHYKSEVYAEASKAVLKSAPDLLAGSHIEPSIFTLYNQVVVKSVKSVKFDPTNLNTAFKDNLAEVIDGIPLCIRGFGYFEQYLEDAFNTVSASEEKSTNVKSFAQQVADRAVVCVAAKADPFDKLLSQYKL